MDLLKKTYFIIPKHQRKNIFFLSLLIILQVLIEMLGLGLIIPLISVILDINLFYETLNFIDLRKYKLQDNTIIFIVFGSFLTIYYIKNLYLVFFSWIRNKFSTNIWTNVCSNLISSYLSKPYLYHVDINTSELLRNMEDAKNFETFLSQVIFLAIELLIISFILTSLLILNPKLTIIVLLIVFSFAVIFLQLTRKKLRSWGEQRTHFRKQSTKFLIEAIMGIKQSKVNNVIKFFKDRYIKANKYHSHLHFKYSFVDSLPKLLIEIVSVTTIILILLVLFNSKIESEKIILIMSFLSACTIRLMPSTTKIISSFNTISFLKPVIKNLYDVINEGYIVKKKLEKNFKTYNHIDFNKNIIVEKLNFNFIKNKIIFENLNFKINKGEFIGLLGKSGSGKSTFINLLLGLLIPQSGRILVDGIDIQHNLYAWRNLIGYVPQDIYIIDDTLRNNIAFGVDENKIDEKKIDEVIKRSQLQDFLRNLPDGINTNLGENASKISFGQRQRIGIARALYKDPKILIFDEATSNLDEETSKEFMEFIFSIRKNFTTIFITHKVDSLSKCDFIYKIKKKNFEKISI